jgi:Tol biopolymer transport system component
LGAFLSSIDRVHWSPDGRWLLTIWQQSAFQEGGALYLLATDGSEGRLLTDGAASPVWLGGWSPDGRQVYYADGATGEAWAVDVETGERDSESSLLDVIFWSPNGEHGISFDNVHPTATGGQAAGTASIVSRSAQDPGGARRIADRVVPGISWSPDSSKLALTLENDDPDGRAVAVYDLASEGLTPLVTLADLRAAVLSFEGNAWFDGVEPGVAADSPLVDLWLGGWSADGSRFFVRALGEWERPSGRIPVALVIVSLDGSSPRVLAFSPDGDWYSPTWSPTNPDRLTLVRQMNGYLFDLEAGPLYTAVQSSEATWSPDGAWVAFAGRNQVTVVSQEGEVRSVWRHGGICSVPSWNPAADLTLPDVECAAGLDLWIAEGGVYRVGNMHMILVHNRGDQAVRNVPARIVDATGNSSNIMSLGSVPPCGSLLVGIPAREWVGPLTVVVNPPQEPGALPENDYGNNQVTVTLPEP